MSQPTATNRAYGGLIGGFIVIGVLAALYLVPSANLGFWEPWETSLATLGRHISTTDGSTPFVPIRAEALIARPWLETTLLTLGYEFGGGSEFGFRLPMALLTIFAALFAFFGLNRFFGPLRAGAAAVLFGVTPLALLSSTNLAGAAFYVAPSTVALVAAGLICGDPDRGRPWLMPVFGAALAGCVWGGGALGFAIPVGALAFFAIGTREEEFADDPSFVALLVGGLIAMISVVGPLALFASLGWESSRDLVGIGFTVGGPAALLVAAAPGSRARFLFDPVYGTAALAVFVALVAPPLIALQTTVGWDDTFAFLLYADFLTERVFGDHVTYDVLVRLVGASAYPTTMLVPFGFAYLIHSAAADSEATIDRDEGPRAFKHLLVYWMVVGFLVVGLGATLTGNTTFPLALPMTASVALALGDPAWMRRLSANRLARYVAAVAGLLLLVMLSKDVRGTFDSELGRPGPHVIFEFLLVDGEVDFPPSYAFSLIKVFVSTWAVILVAVFVEPITNVGRLGAIMERFGTPVPLPEGSRIQRLLARLVGLARRPSYLVGRLMERLARRAANVFDVAAAGLSAGAVGLLLLTVTITAWAGVLAFRDVPTVTHHLSPKGIMDTFHELTDEGATLYSAGVTADDNSYYLGLDDIERLPRIADIRDLFCESEERVFVVIPTSRLAEAHYEVRHGRDDDSPCSGGSPFYVVDGRSSRYALASNQLDIEAGETDESLVAANVFTEETLPEGVERPGTEVLVEDKLRLAAFSVEPRSIDSGDLAVTAYWEVLERPTSNHEIFIHVDFGGNRLNGDHDPVEGHYPMRYWVPGEIVRDRHVLEVSRADRAGTYTVFYGFFRGDNRLSIEPSESEQRLRLGVVEVR